MSTRTSRDRKIIFILILAVIVELTLLLAHSGVIPIGSGDGYEGQRAGQVVHSNNHLRRRSINSLIWETSGPDEIVYYHDSLLTLKESTATLKLDNDTEVRLSENTLISIDPPEQHQTGEIRLRFVRGNLQARNPFQASKIEAKQMSLNIKSGSEVELREVGTDGVEVQLKSGEAVVQIGDQSSSLVKNEILRLDTEGADRLRVDDRLTWINPPPKRIYYHGELVPVSLEWQGKAREIVVQTLGEPERTIKLPENTTTQLVDLKPGHHRLYLRDEHRSSSSLDVQVWKAPIIHLISPLPRDRVEMNNEVPFVWQKHKLATKFRVKIHGERTRLTEDVSQNELTQKFEQEDDLQWFVEGFDADGFLIPPLYRNPLYIRENPFAPPRLKSPELRAPAKEKDNRGAWLWRIIFPVAHAAEKEKFEAVFAWEPVPGADQYVIEISESPNFRDPVVNQTVREAEFVWRDFGFKEYYWRVAAGHSKGRMGVFSQVVKLDFTPLKQNPDLKNISGVVIRRKTPKVTQVSKPKANSPAEKPKPPPKVPAPAPVATETAPPEFGPAKNWRRSVLWSPRYSHMDHKGEDNISASMNGFTFSAIGFEFPWKDAQENIWLFDGEFASYRYKPVDKEEFAVQEDLSWSEIQFSALRFRSLWGYGVTIESRMGIERKDRESIRGFFIPVFGPTMQRNFTFGQGEFRFRMGALFSTTDQGVRLQPEWRQPIGERFSVGAGIETVWFSTIGLTLHGTLTFGLSW